MDGVPRKEGRAATVTAKSDVKLLKLSGLTFWIFFAKDRQKQKGLLTEDRFQKTGLKQKTETNMRRNRFLKKKGLLSRNVETNDRRHYFQLGLHGNVLLHILINIFVVREVRCRISKDFHVGG